MLDYRNYDFKQLEKDHTICITYYDEDGDDYPPFGDYRYYDDDYDPKEQEIRLVCSLENCKYLLWHDYGRSVKHCKQYFITDEMIDFYNVDLHEYMIAYGDCPKAAIKCLEQRLERKQRKSRKRQQN